MILESAIEIMNMALRHLGTLHQIATVDEISAEANACRDFYGRAVEETMMEFLWTFGSQTIQLTEIAGPDMSPQTAVSPEFLYGYQYPPEAVHIRRLFGSLSNGAGAGEVLWAGGLSSGWPWNWDSTQGRLPYKIMPNPTKPTSLLIACNWPGIWAEITVSKMPENLIGSKVALALSFRLAHYIAPSILQADPAKLGDRAKAMFEEKIREAKSINISEQQDPPLPDSEFVRTRNGSVIDGFAGGSLPYTIFPGGFNVD